MSNPKHEGSSSERIGAGKTVPMPDYQYQRLGGKSGGATSDKKPVKTGKIAALQNWVPAS